MKMIAFKERIKQERIEIRRESIETLQVNIGKKCNQTCSHCHVAAGPGRTENMDRKTVDRLLELLAVDGKISTVDITGGAPELNPDFRYFVTRLRQLQKHVIDRCNLTVLLEDGQGDTPSFLAQNRVEVIASLPCYTEQNVDAQRGEGVFAKSVGALKKLNDAGYGQQESGLLLNLAYNPGGAFLPGDQQKLEDDYKRRLFADHGIVFNKLYTITNIPINRFARQLREEGKLDEYMAMLSANFNVCAAANVMCSRMISVGWDGRLYDCDFNQMLEQPIDHPDNSIFTIGSFADITKNIVVHDACFGCTAGSGSSCGGALV